MYLFHNSIITRIRKIYFAKLLNFCRNKKDHKILDYGCGPGDFLDVAQQKGLICHGVDSSACSVDMARARGFDVVLADSSNLPYEENYFDMIILQSVIEHIENPISALHDLVKHLADDGIIIISAPTPSSTFWDDPTHVRPYTPKSFMILGEILKLEVIKITYIFAFLMGLSIKSSLIYKLMNLIPLPLGSNLVAVYRKVKSQNE